MLLFVNNWLRKQKAESLLHFLSWFLKAIPPTKTGKKKWTGGEGGHWGTKWVDFSNHLAPCWRKIKSRKCHLSLPEKRMRFLFALTEGRNIMLQCVQGRWTKNIEQRVGSARNHVTSATADCMYQGKRQKCVCVSSFWGLKDSWGEWILPSRVLYVLWKIC